jgi:Arc-like DNA binding domain
MHNTCMEQEPKQKITFVVPRPLIERLRAVAKRNRRSLVSELVWALEQYLRQQEQP